MTTAIFILFMITQSGKEVQLDDAKSSIVKLYAKLLEICM